MIMSNEPKSYERHPLYTSKTQIDAIIRALSRYSVFCETQSAIGKAIKLFPMEFPNILVSQSKDIPNLTSDELTNFYDAEIKVVQEVLNAAKKVKKTFKK